MPVYDDSRMNQKFRQVLPNRDNAVADFASEFILLRDGYLEFPSYMSVSRSEIFRLLCLVSITE